MLGFGTPDPDATITTDLDRALLARLDELVDEATKAFGDFDYARALERTEALFWWFCDDYVELVKSRAYDENGGAGTQSARLALGTALSVFQRLFAPFLPFVTDEVWSWSQEGSIHRADWPTNTGSSGDPAILGPVCDALGVVRRAEPRPRSPEPRSPEPWSPRRRLPSALRRGEPDLVAAASIRSIEYVEGGDLVSVAVDLVPADAQADPRSVELGSPDRASGDGARTDRARLTAELCVSVVAPTRQRTGRQHAGESRPPPCANPVESAAVPTVVGTPTDADGEPCPACPSTLLPSSTRSKVVRRAQACWYPTERRSNP
ncbi:MAG: class I tRNA ligase family protein [Ilumatobacteraceae bacterium]